MSTTETARTPLTNSEMAEAATSAAALLRHLPADSMTVTRHGVVVQTANEFTFGRWAETAKAAVNVKALYSDRGVKRAAWGELAGFSVRVELTGADGMSGPQICDAPRCTEQAVTFDESFGFACGKHAPEWAESKR